MLRCLAGSFQHTIGLDASRLPLQFLSAASARPPFLAKPIPLDYDRPYDTAHPWVEESFLGRMALTVMGYYSRNTKLQRGAENLYAAIQNQAENVYLQQTLGLPPRFTTIHSLLCLHTWLVFGRLRLEEKDGRDLSQLVHDAFQEDVERRVRKEGVKVRVGKILTELEMGFYGSSNAYDKALKGEGDFVEVLIRNVYEGKKDSAHHAKVLERYLKREIACLAMTSNETVMKGQIQFTIDF